MSIPPFIDLPPGVHAETVVTERGPLATLRAGRAGGAAALLVPGITGSKEDFIAVLAPLAEAGFGCVAMDLGGQFESPPSVGGYSLTGFADDVLAAARAVGTGPVHVVGHSFGGLVARAAVIGDPHVFASLTLMASGPAAPPAEQVDRLRLFALVLAEHGPAAAWAAKQAVDEREGVLPPTDPAIDGFLTRRFMGNDPASVLAMIDILVSEPDRVDELADAVLPKLVLFGVDDDAWPPETQSHMAKRLDADVVAVEGAGHSPAVDRPDQTAAALADFWGR